MVLTCKDVYSIPSTRITFWDCGCEMNANFLQHQKSGWRRSASEQCHEVTVLHVTGMPCSPTCYSIQITAHAASINSSTSNLLQHLRIHRPLHLI